MSGTSTNEVRSAFVKEATVGTTPSTPSFATSHRPIRMSAIPNVFEDQSLTGHGARTGRGYGTENVSGTLESPFYYGVYDTLLETLLQGEWGADVLKDGKDTVAVTVENTFPAGNGGTDTMLRYRGVEAVSGTLNLTAEQEARLTLNMIGRASDDSSTSAISGATYTDPPVVNPLLSGGDVGTIVYDGYTLDCMQSLEIAFNFEDREREPRVGSNALCGIRRGNFLPTLTANMYVEANFAAIYDDARASHSSFAVTVPLGSVSGEKYTIEFPVCYFGGTEIDMSGTGLMHTVPIVPHYDPDTEEAVVKITRAVS